jgi:hypothetical protein
MTRLFQIKTDPDLVRRVMQARLEREGFTIDTPDRRRLVCVMMKGKRGD